MFDRTVTRCSLGLKEAPSCASSWLHTAIASLWKWTPLLSFLMVADSVLSRLQMRWVSSLLFKIFNLLETPVNFAKRSLLAILCCRVVLAHFLGIWKFKLIWIKYLNVRGRLICFVIMSCLDLARDGGRRWDRCNATPNRRGEPLKLS